jgi:4-diphosphocytidyl-2-C-methyl-D-erythritol kinase
MYLRKAESRRTVGAPAKLNLYLEVLGRRDDGYHELETLMVPLRLRDSLSMAPAPPSESGRLGPIHLNVRGAFPLINHAQQALPPAGDENLIVRALELLRRRSGCQLGAEVELVKRIPLAAGLGGGSSDAAAALCLANRVWQLGWSSAQLAEIAAELGSDVPFFLAGGPAICRGRGERVERLPRFLPLHVVIAKPRWGLPTSDVYQALDRQAPAKQCEAGQLGGLLRVLRQGNWSELGHWMGNRLEAAAAALLPWVEQAREAFAQLGFVGHQLAGSGTAYFGVCRQAQHAQRLATILRTRQLGLVYVTRSC